ncbi:MAG: PAS domain S-box protein [Syntrophales bacterium]|nr:PAS domain S-box protein [Syntrophales bacterium]
MGEHKRKAGGLGKGPRRSWGGPARSRVAKGGYPSTLGRGEQFAKAFLENPTPMAITTIGEGRFIAANAAFRKLMGLGRQRVKGRRSVEMGIITEEQRRRLLAELKTSRRVMNMEMAIKTRHREMRHVLVNSSLIDLGGERHLLSVFVDITDRKRMEKALEASEKRYRTIYENTTLGIFETTPSGQLVHANATFAAMFGYPSPRDAVLEIRDVAQQIYVEPHRRAAIIAEVLSAHGPMRFEVAYRRRDGTTFPAILEMQAVWSAEAGEYHLLGFVEDITRRRQAEALYRTLAEGSFAGVYVTQNGVFRFINSHAASYAGYTREELLGQRAKMLIHPEDVSDAAAHAVAMLRGERVDPYEFRIVTKDGRVRWIMETVIPIAYNGAPAVLGNSMDVTRLKEMEAERERLIGELQDHLQKIKKLSGLLPICASCKKIRNDEGYWQQLETYIRDHSEAEFSHSLCPECVEKLYPWLAEGRKA